MKALLRLPSPPSFGGLRICGHQLAQFAGDREGVDRLPILKLSPGRRRGRGFCLCGALALKYNWGREVADALLRNASHQQRRPSRKSPPRPNSSRDLICLGPPSGSGLLFQPKTFTRTYTPTATKMALTAISASLATVSPRREETGGRFAVFRSTTRRLLAGAFWDKCSCRDSYGGNASTDHPAA